MHEFKLVRRATDQFRQCLRRLRPLQREQRAVVHVIERNLVGQVFAQEADIVPFARPIDHDVELRRIPFIRGDIGHHQIIEDAAILVEQQRIADSPGLKRGEIARHDRFERLGRALALHHQLAHVGNVEQPGMLARPEVFGDDAPMRAGVLYRHVITGKLDHPRAVLAMPGVERQVLHFDSVVFGLVVCLVVCFRGHAQGSFAGHARIIQSPLCHGT